MRILFTGRGTSGSWQIRGVQMAAELGATATPERFMMGHHLKGFDVIVAVKRVSDELLRQIRASGRPWVWDIVDAYPQPECAGWTRQQSIRWAVSRLEHLRPTAVIWPNERMREDCEGSGPVVYHHHRPGLHANPIRDRLEVIGYEGGRQYLAQWRTVFERAAAAIGARFDDRATSPAACDVIVAVRGAPYHGYACRHWKSNVKLANAHGSGTPFIGQRDASYMETQAGGEQWIESEADVLPALMDLHDRKARKEIARRFLGAALPLASAASQVQSTLERIA